MRTPAFATAIFLMIASLSYNIAWLASASSVVEMVCISHLATVRADAIHHEENEAWMRAAHAYAQLLEYGPAGRDVCREEDLKRGAWLLPVAAMALNLGASPAESGLVDREHLEARYLEAIRRADLASRPQLSAVQP